MRINREMVERLPASVRDEVREHLDFQEARYVLHHKLQPSELRKIFGLVLNWPRLLLSREFYGRLRRWVI